MKETWFLVMEQCWQLNLAVHKMFVNEIKDVCWLQGSLYAISEVSLSFEKFDITTFSWRMYEIQFLSSRLKRTM